MTWCYWTLKIAWKNFKQALSLTLHYMHWPYPQFYFYAQLWNCRHVHTEVHLESGCISWTCLQRRWYLEARNKYTMTVLGKWAPNNLFTINSFTNFVFHPEIGYIISFVTKGLSLMVSYPGSLETYCCCNKSLQMYWLTTTQMYYLKVLKVQSPKIKVSAGLTLKGYLNRNGR